MEKLETLLENDSIIGALVISRVAGGEVIESAIKNANNFQNLLELSLDYIDKFMSYKIESSKYSNLINDKNLKKIKLEYEEYTIDFIEVKNDDIFLVVLYDNTYPKGINELYIKMAFDYVFHSY
ncbi:MAG: hypothetical protein N2485_04340 [bacterium]|nr:hypothetical protein [bacterium]